MAKRLSTEETLARLRKIAQGSLSEDDVKEIKKALSSANNLIVAKAANIVATHAGTDLIPLLVKAFHKFMQKPVKIDARCLAKIAIIKALDSLECQEYDIFLQGLHHVQLEPVYGGHEDTAAELRAQCALSLARLEYDTIFFELTSLLIDSETQARLGAIKALTYMNEEKSELLLRLKVLTGDKEPQVLGECFAALMSVAPERSMPFVAKFLNASDPLIAEGASLALGESRKPQACTLLCDLWEDTLDRELNMMLLLPIALTRCDAAFKFLLDVVYAEYQDYAAAAVKALKVYGDNETQQKKIRQAAMSRSEDLIAETYAREFNGK